MRLRELCEERFNVSVGGGLGPLNGHAFRIGHMGNVNEPYMLGALGAVETGLRILGIPHGRHGVSAAIERLAADG